MQKLLFIFGFLSILSCTNNVITNKKVAIQPFGNFDQAITDSISSVIQTTYGLDVEILQSIQLPEHSFVNIKSPRYRADTIIKFLKENKSKGFNYILGLTEKDISTTKRNKDGSLKQPQSKYADWGIFGLGYRPGPSCIVSSFRIKKKVSSKKYMERIKKIVLHELGHNFGLPHCDSGKPCVMEDAAEKISTIDNAPYSICEACKNDLN